MPRITIVVDANLCIGAAACVADAPSFFRLDEENQAVVINPANDADERSLTLEVTADENEDLVHAMQGCPTGAITVRAE